MATRLKGTFSHIHMKEMKGIGIVLLGISFSLILATESPAYGAFDKDGSYFCNPANISLEKIIYKASVTRFDDDIDSYLSLNPSASYQELRDYMVHSSAGTIEPTYQIMNQAQSCLLSSGVNPQTVATPINITSKLGYAPEFGSLTILVVLFSVLAVIIITKRFEKSPLSCIVRQ